MIIEPLKIKGSFLIKKTKNIDQRGYFERTYCEREFRNAGIDISIRQMNLCVNNEKFTLRGMHLQRDEYAEDKVVSCTRGKIFDVFVDMREKSETYLQYEGYELSEENGYMLYIPKGCAHGYITLESNCQLLYLMSEFYTPTEGFGYRYDDPIIGIKWPEYENLIISQKDLNWDYLKIGTQGGNY